MSQTTQCPHCLTRFKISDEQLHAAHGKARCGQCLEVFDARKQLLSSTVIPTEMEDDRREPAPSPYSTTANPTTIDDFELEVPDFDPTVTRLDTPGDLHQDTPDVSAEEAPSPLTESPSETITSAFPDTDRPSEQDFQHALHEDMSPDTEETAHASLETDTGSLEENHTELTATQPLPDSEPEAPIYATSSTMDEEASLPTQATPLTAPSKKPRRLWLTLLLTLIGVLLFLALLGQLLFFNRTRIASEIPDLRPVLETACKPFRCTVPLPTQIAKIRTEWSDLAFVPDQPRYIQLAATIKNLAPYPQAYPLLELTLTDKHEHIVSRRIFKPREYLKPDDFKLGRFNGNSEVKVLMHMDMGKMQATGYSLLLFYP